MCALLAPGQFYGFYSYSIFFSLSALGQHSSFKSKGLSKDPQRPNIDFLEKGSNDFD
jgi:hypothetical protein